LALGLAAERLISELFAANEWLGWLGLVLAAIFAGALAALLTREALALRRLRTLDRLRRQAAEVLISDRLDAGNVVRVQLNEIYMGRPDLARAREALDRNARDVFDG